jgi:coenzyme PQQ precursor peptide PqqA
MKPVADCILRGASDCRFEGIEIMEWTAPTFEEVALNCEINSYASAAL